MERRQVCACTLYSVHAYNALRGGQRVGGDEKRLFVLHKDGKHICNQLIHIRVSPLSVKSWSTIFFPADRHCLTWFGKN
jgi:hypothetical protein